MFLSKKKLYIIISIVIVLVISFVGAKIYLDNTNMIDVSKYTTSCTKAVYNEEYMDENRGKVIFEVLEVYELVHIIIAVTDYGIEDDYLVNKNGDYYERAMEYFLPYKGHEAVKAIEDDLLKYGYYSLKNNSFSYSFEGDKIVKGNTYHPGPSTFEENLKYFEDFAKDTNFREFYKENEEYYKSQTEELKEILKVDKMWNWLEEQFPAKYHSHRLVFSPLVGGSHNTWRFKDFNNDYSETILFVNGPGSWDRFMLPENVTEGMLVGNTFTEIDHNYVNPVTDEYIKKVIKVFKKVNKWNGQNSGSYNNETKTFNEYMTWGTYLIYTYENYNKEDFEAIREFQVRLMKESRNFIKYDEFSKKLLEIYLSRKEDETLYDLYPEILEMASKIK